MRTYELLATVLEKNPEILYFVLRLYRDVSGVLGDPEDSVDYHFLKRTEVSGIAKQIETYEAS